MNELLPSYMEITSKTIRIPLKQPVFHGKYPRSFVGGSVVFVSKLYLVHMEDIFLGPFCYEVQATFIFWHVTFGK